MDKSKNKTDLLAAGRKKLQQFRQKKDNKGGGGRAKHPSKAGKADKDGAGDADEQEKVPEAEIPLDLTRSVDSLSMPSSGMLDGEVPNLLGDQETKQKGLERCNGGSSDQCNGESSAAAMLTTDSAGDDARIVKDHMVVSTSGMEEDDVVHSLSVPAEVDHRGVGEIVTSTRNLELGCLMVGDIADDSSVRVHSVSVHTEVDHREGEGIASTTNLEVGCLVSNNGGNGTHVMSEDNAVEVIELNEESGAALGSLPEGALDEIGFSAPVEASQETSTSPSDEPEEGGSHKGHFKLPTLSLDSETESIVHVEDVKGEEGVNEGDDTHRTFVMEKVTVENESMCDPPKVGFVSFMAEGVREESPLFLLENSFTDELESLKRHLYLSNIVKDFLQLQLAEQIELNVEADIHSSDEASKLRILVKESQESKVMVCEELMKCKSELQAIAIEKEVLENHCLSSKEENEKVCIRVSQLQGKLERSQEELSLVSAELADCRASFENLQMKNENLAASLAMEADAKEKLVEENTRLSFELSQQHEWFLTALNKQIQLEGELRETEAFVEELSLDNLYLSSSLVVHEVKITELHAGGVCQIDRSEVKATCTDNSVQDSQIIYVNRDVDVSSCTGEDATVPLKYEVYSGSFAATGILKGHLKEANSILENLEKLIQEMHSHFLSLSRSGGRAAAPGVSKLIQAFESKHHHSDNTSDMEPLIEVEKLEGSFTLVREQSFSLKDTLKQMDLETRNVEVFLAEEQLRKKLSEQIEMEHETQRQRNEILQTKIDDNVEKLSSYKSRLDDLQNVLYEVQQSANNEAGAFLSRTELLQKEVSVTVSNFKREKDSIGSMILGTIAKLNESTGLVMSDNLDVGSLVSASVDAATVAIKGLHDNLEAVNLNYSNLNTSFQDLNKLCTDAEREKELVIIQLNNFYNRLLELVNGLYGSAVEPEIILDSEGLFPEKCDKLIGLLQELLDERLGLLSTNSKLESELLNKNQEIGELSIRIDGLTRKSEDLCQAKDGLESVLMNRSTDVEEFSKRCLVLEKKLEAYYLDEGSETIPVLAEGSAMFVEGDSSNSDSCNSPLFWLESLVDLHLQKHKEAIEHINLSKNYLREVGKLPEHSTSSWSSPLPVLLHQVFVPQFRELQENFQLLSVSNVQMENEMQILKEGLRKMEEALEASHSDLNMKASDLEQSEQRLSVVREKLSIAVAKGKGLIVHRDSLKQSLLEKSSELEKCTQELISKEALLHEAEAKLKSCSEVERVEALESELSYIRNSATAMRDSFLLKDSVLQRIEEVLEDLDLPEHFHSKDIVEKIELLARSAAANTSFTMTDWDQKSSVGGSQYDAGFVVMDGWKDEMQPISNPDFDEMKRRTEDLQSKLYGLAEHNDMLEQSLMERNNLVQKWEEILNEIDMPAQLRTLELDHKLGWLKRELSEVQKERDSLQVKIENLEDSADMLIVDLEESHKKISELSAEIVAVKSEREFFSESLDKLRYEYLGLSEKSVQDEMERENLRRELAEVQEKLFTDYENKAHCNMEKEMRRLHDVIISGLPDRDSFDILSGGSNVECLEELLKMLIDGYKTLYVEKSLQEDAKKENILDVSNLPPGQTVSKHVLDAKEQELEVLRLELDEISCNMVVMKEEKDAAQEKCKSLMLEMEMINNQRNLLQEERAEYVEKYQTLEQKLEELKLELDETSCYMVVMKEGKDAAQEKYNSLMLEIEMINNQRNLLQEERNEYVEKYQSLEQKLEELRLELDETSRNMVVMMEERDAAQEKCNSLMLEMEMINNQRDLLQGERNEYVEKYQSLEQKLEELRLELDQTSHNMVIMKEEKDAAQEKCHSLMLEIEMINNQRNLSQEERAKDLEKYQPLEQKLEDLRLEVDETSRNMFIMKEEKNAAQEKCHSLMLELEMINNQRNLLQEERTKDLEKYQSLVLELEAAIKQRSSLQEQLIQEEQKSMSTREKLNVAVRKGKGLVQQRDSLKQTIEEMNATTEGLKLEHNRHIQALESEKSLLKYRLAETEQSLQDSSQTLNRLLTALHGIDAVSEVNNIDPVEKLEGFRKLYHDLHSAVVSLEQEAKKSKRAAELLHSELNEVQERADILQEELEKAVAAKSDAVSCLEQFKSVHSEERQKQIHNIVELMSGIDQLKKGCFEFSSLLSNVFTKDADILRYMEAFMESIFKQMNGANIAELPVLASNRFPSGNPVNEGKSLDSHDDSVHKTLANFDESLISEHFSLVSSSLHECMREYADVKENIQRHSFTIDHQAASLLKIMGTVQKKLSSHKEVSESLEKDVANLEMMMKEKEAEVSLMRRNVSLLYEACERSIVEIENRQSQVSGTCLAPGEHTAGKSGAFKRLQSYADRQDNGDGHFSSVTDECVIKMADALLSAVKGSSNINEIAEGNERELKATIADLQGELQEKDIKTSRICAELVSQIREAEAVAKKSVVDLNSAREQIYSLEKQVESIESDRKLLELRVSELKEYEDSSKDLQEKIKSLSIALSSKYQEIEALMQALDEEESQMEDLETRRKELEDIVQEKTLELESLEASRLKAVSKLSTTVSKFDELHNLSESLLSEIESLQLQLQGRDSEISFLRQEVTRCTDDILASQEDNKKYSSDVRELLTWMDLMLTHIGVPHVGISDLEGSQLHAYTDIIEKKLVSIMTELGDLRKSAESKDALLQIERDRVEELSCKAEVLETSLRERKSQVELFHGRTDADQPSSTNTQVPSDLKQMRDSMSFGRVKTHVRSGRKINSDQIAVAIDIEQGDTVLEDEDDDKAHGFKSLTMSRIVPRATRPLVDRIDGIWVSGERLLMRQPTLRLGVILYWIALHIFLVSVV